MFAFEIPPPLALYVHVPWCVRKCPYCDFNSHAAPAALPEADYVSALLDDLEEDAARIAGRRIETVFIGGGTPSLLSAAAVARLLTGIRTRVALAEDAEITLEANPGTADAARFAGYRAAGVNRLSIGVQSFDDGRLAAIGRIHGGRQARAAVAIAGSAGFTNVNLDLMFGLPGQTPAAAVADVATAIALAPTHISHYQLTLEPGTPFHHRPPPLPEDDSVWMMQARCAERLAAAGYGRYEVSAHARPGAQCRHNLNYWCYGDYLGIGAGAHGKLTDPDRQQIERRVKQRQPRRYLEGARGGTLLASSCLVSAQEAPFEFMLNALRLCAGFPESLFRTAVGLPLAAVAEPLGRAQERGLLRWNDGWVRPTERGRRFLNELLLEFLPPTPAAAGATAATH